MMERFEKVDKRFEKMEQKMATKDDLAVLNKKLDRVINRYEEKFDGIEKRMIRAFI
jgi:hypothetical protein